MAQTFYVAMSELCFVLLGLWWVVVQLRIDRWAADRARRRFAYYVSLQFLFPGVMSLVAVIADRANLLWRIGFVSAGVLGIVSAVAMLREPPQRGEGRVRRVGPAVMLVFYVLVTLFAAAPSLPRSFGLGLTALETEAVLVSLFVFCGVNVAWLFLVEESAAPAVGS